MKVRLLFFGIVSVLLSISFSARAQIGGAPQASGYDFSPTMNADVSSMITTGNAYDGWTGSPHRVVTDFEVPGAVGQHGLKWTRTWTPGDKLVPAGWSFSYTWRYIGRHAILVQSPTGTLSYQYFGEQNFMIYPDGRRGKFEAGTKDRVIYQESNAQIDHIHVLLEDGGDIYMENYEDNAADELGQTDGTVLWVDHFYPTQITDRYGRVTSLVWQCFGSPNLPLCPYNDDTHLMKVTDPSGRWIQIVYGNSNQGQPTLVYGSDGQWVQYSWTGSLLTDVYYSDGTSAHYTYTSATYVSQNTDGGNLDGTGLLKTAQDTHAEGAMRSISYDYVGENGSTPVANWKGEILDERDLTSNTVVTSCDHTIGRPDTDGVRTETRGDGRHRAIHMHKPSFTCSGDPPWPCDQNKQPPLVMSKEDYNGVAETFTYYNNGYTGNNTASLLQNYLHTVTDRNGNTTTYNLEPVIGDPTSIVHPDGTHIDYAYNEPLNLDPNPTPAPSSGIPVPVQTQNAPGDADNPYYVSTVTDERGPGHVTTYTRDHTRRADGTISHLVTRIDYPRDSSNLNDPATFEMFTYNNFGQVIVHQRKNGAYEYAAYDSTGLLTDATNPTSNYYSNFDGTSATFPFTTEAYVHYDYYGAGEAWPGRVKTVTDARGNRTTYEYDSPTTCGQNGVSPVLPPDQGGGTLQCRGRGLVTKITYPDDTHGGSDANGTSKSFTYDIYGNKKSEADELSHTSLYDYDDYNRLIKATDPLGNFSQTDYTFTNSSTGASSPYFHTTKSVTMHTTPAGIRTAQTFDNNLRLSTKTEAYNTPVAAKSYYDHDANGNQTNFTDPRGAYLGDPAYTTITSYDSRNRKQTVTDPLGHVTKWHYGDGINLTSIDHPDGTTESKIYDWMNRVITDTVPKDGTPTTDGTPATVTSSITTSFIYNPAGTLKSVTDGNGHMTTFDYGPNDLKKTMTFQNGDYESYLYDKNFNLTARKTSASASPVWQQFAYDSRNRKIGMSWHSGPNATDPTLTWANGADASSFVYDEASRLTTAQNSFSTIARQYDNANRLTDDKQTLAGFVVPMDVQYTYDADSRVTDVSISKLYDETRGYDLMGRLQSVGSTSGGNIIQYQYDPASNVKERDTLANNSKIVTPHDALNRMQQRDVDFGGSTISSEAYTYSVMSRLTNVGRTEDGKSDAFDYNLNGELTSAKYGLVNGTPLRDVSYALDYVGNRTNVKVNGVNTAYTPDNINRYTSVGGQPLTTGPDHEIGNYQANTYSYVGDTFLAQIAGAGGNTNFPPGSLLLWSNVPATYTLGYDALGRCVKRTFTSPITVSPGAPAPLSNSATSYYVYDGDKPIYEVNLGTGLTATNMYGIGIDEIVSRTTGNNTYYFYQDHEGSVTHVANGSSIVESYRYDAFGAPTIYNSAGQPINSSSIGNRFLFTGREYQSTFGIYEYRNRAYHPGLGRFMSEDPKGFVHRAGLGKEPDKWSFEKHPDEGELNLFRYCGNDPEDFTDPMGLYFFPLPPQQQKTFDKVRKYLSQDSKLKALFDKIAADKQHGVKVIFSDKTSYSCSDQFKGYGKRTGQNIVATKAEFEWNPNLGRLNDDGSRNSPASVLGHELDHAYRWITDPNGYRRDTAPDGPGYTHQYGNFEEKRVITGSEAHASRTLAPFGEGRRDNGNGRPFLGNGPLPEGF